MEKVDSYLPVRFHAKETPSIGVGILLVVLPFSMLMLGILLFELLLDLFWGDRLLYYGIGAVIALLFSLPGISMIRRGKKIKKRFGRLIENGCVTKGEITGITIIRRYNRTLRPARYDVYINYKFNVEYEVLFGDRERRDKFSFITLNPESVKDMYKEGQYVDVLYDKGMSVVLTCYTPLGYKSADGDREQ